MLPILQSKLHDRSLVIDGEKRPGASIFPLFNARGRTELLMVTTEDSSTIGLLPCRSKRFRRRLVRPSRLTWGDQDARPPTEAVPRLATLWHLDPWWALTDPRYAGHPLVPALKATNLSGYDDRWQDAWFDRHLGRIRLLQQGKDEQAATKRFTPALLTGAQRERARRQADDAARQRAVVATRGNWRLRPFWQRASA